MVSLLPDEQVKHQQKGYEVKDGFLQADPKTGLCPHKRQDGFCGVHGTALKPFGCIASPFTLNKTGTLIIRDRYTKLKCHGTGEPAYKTFRASLDLIFGDDEAERVCEDLESGKSGITAKIPEGSYHAIRYLDGLKHGSKVFDTGNQPTWLVGDAANVKSLCPGEYDMVFSCPPYHDLELYSDDPADLSTMTWDDFLDKYTKIIKECADLLKPNRFAVFVVSQIRDKKTGLINDLVGWTVQAFQDAGMHFYNDMVFLNALGSLPIRISKQFKAGRKIGRAHQNVLVFVKGDPRKAVEAIGNENINGWPYK